RDQELVLPAHRAPDGAVPELLRDEAEVRRDLVVIEGRLDLRLELNLAVDLERVDERLSTDEVLATALDRDAGDGSAGHEVERLLSPRELERDLVAAAGLPGVLDGLGGRGRGGERDERHETDECCGERLHAWQNALLRVQSHRGFP